MPGYKLSYFDLRGRAEVIRLIFAAVGQNFEDHTIPLGMKITEFTRELDPQHWIVIKPTLPFGQLPVLEIKSDDGKVTTIAQTAAIMRYLARKFDLYGSDEIEMAQCDMYAECLADFTYKLVEWMWCPVKETKNTLKQTLLNELLPKTMNAFEKKLNESTSGFLIGSKLSYIDIMLFRLCEGANDNFLNAQPLIFDNYPHVKALYARIGSLPNIAEYIANRPNYVY